MTTEPNKPCPFCGGTNIDVCQGASYRYLVAFCRVCDAKAGEVRKQTLGIGPEEKWYEDGVKKALAQWNYRARKCE